MTNQPLEPEDLSKLRHRFGRCIEAAIAYNTFLRKEIHVGPEYTCTSAQVVQQTTHTLFIGYYSYIYSLFDPSGTDFRKTFTIHRPYLPQDAIEAGVIALQTWAKIEKPMASIRSNIGFHHGALEKRSDHGYASYANINPYAAELIIQSLRVFFRSSSDVFTCKDKYGSPPSQHSTGELLSHVKTLHGALLATGSFDKLPVLHLLA
jgi:hypothetical protein